jgi:hypothetical protein
MDNYRAAFADQMTMLFLTTLLLLHFAAAAAAGENSLSATANSRVSSADIYKNGVRNNADGRIDSSLQVVGIDDSRTFNGGGRENKLTGANVCTQQEP